MSQREYALRQFLERLNQNQHIEQVLREQQRILITLLDNLPGQDFNRRVVVMHNNMVYSLMFMPLSPEAEPMYQAVLESLRFVK